MPRYRIEAGGSPVDCPNRIRQDDQKFTIETDRMPEVGDDATIFPRYKGIRNCYSWISAFSCDDVKCGLGRIVSIEEEIKRYFRVKKFRSGVDPYVDEEWEADIVIKEGGEPPKLGFYELLVFLDEKQEIPRDLVQYQSGRILTIPAKDIPQHKESIDKVKWWHCSASNNYSEVCLTEVTEL